jgi:hypothetical protein
MFLGSSAVAGFSILMKLRTTQRKSPRRFVFGAVAAFALVPRFDHNRFVVTLDAKPAAAVQATIYDRRTAQHRAEHDRSCGFCGNDLGSDDCQSLRHAIEKDDQEWPGMPSAIMSENSQDRKER